MVEITAAYPAGIISTTKENLRCRCRRGKRRVGRALSGICQGCRRRRFHEIATAFRMIAKVECRAREALPCVARPRRGLQGLRARRSYPLAVPQLRFRD